MTTIITREQASNWESIPLPIFQVNVTKIDVNFPCKFKTARGNNVEPASGFEKFSMTVIYKLNTPVYGHYFNPELFCVFRTFL